MDSATEFLATHIKYAVRHGVVLMPVMFMLGVITGSALTLWPENRVGAVSFIVGASIPAGWFWWAFYRTTGLVHHSGFSRSAPSDDQ